MRQGVLHIIHSREAILVPLDTKSSARTCTFLFSSFASLPGSNPHPPGYFPSRPQSPCVQKHEKDNGKGPGDSIPALEFLASQSAKGAIGSYYGVTSLFAFFFLFLFI
jgi:hypothetical protein